MQLPAVGKTCTKGHPLVMANLVWKGNKFACKTCEKGTEMSRIEKFEAPWGEVYENVEVEVGHYGNGSLAIRLTLPDDGDEVLAIPTINLEQYGVVPPKDHVFIPGYSENKGMLDALVKAGVVEAVEVICDYGPFDAFAQQAKVLPPFLPQEV